MSDLLPLCLICGERHANAVRGGTVTFLRDCFKHGHVRRRATPNLRRPKQIATSSRSMKALTGWGRE